MSLVNEHARYAKMTPDELVPLLCSRMQSEKAAAAATTNKTESIRVVTLVKSSLLNKRHQRNAKWVVKSATGNACDTHKSTRGNQSGFSQMVSFLSDLRRERMRCSKNESKINDSMIDAGGPFDDQDHGEAMLRGFGLSSLL
ncbi:hypothetical protein N7517_006344 [Penicillium concentricum]|uniref:Uncharacterized protein n=1 Tax=Penicillium concentricum TaxID=293559 RepID=A0A9W9SDW7_9EURO|nr:uncharacterized protein N7517_006344 [Penicillium concentricum]KAJ5374338.1 hypothetical protein N7517_006344 [Penicillium concentricum]